MAKTYIKWASCKAIQGQYGEFFNISFNIEELKKYANEKGYVNLTMSKRREVGQYWDTHYFTLNEYKPNTTQENPVNTSSNNDVVEEDISIEDLPF